MMMYREFKELVLKHIRDFLPKEYEESKVEIREVHKNNEVLDGLVIYGKANIAPTIYLNYYYDDYVNGKELTTIMNNIASVRTKYDVGEDYDVSSITNYNSIADKIKARLYGKEGNVIISERPYKIFADDLAITFCVYLGEDGNGGEMSIPITNQLMETWGVDVDTLYSVALQNLDEYRFNTIFEAMMGLTEDMDEFEREMMPSENDETMFVLTNKQKINGAIEIINAKAISEIVKRVGETFYILPSSIHELLIIKDNPEVNVDMLKEMVAEVNDEQVSPRERLSYSVYKYENGKVVRV